MALLVLAGLLYDVEDEEGHPVHLISHSSHGFLCVSPMGSNQEVRGKEETAGTDVTRLRGWCLSNTGSQDNRPEVLPKAILFVLFALCLFAAKNALRP